MKVTGHAYEWDIKDCYTDTDHVEIQAWCKDRDSKEFLMRVQDFPAVCQIELPSHVGRKAKVWRDRDVRRIINYLSYILKDCPPQSHVLRYMPKLYYYRSGIDGKGNYVPKKYPVVMVTFANLKGMWACKRLLDKPRDIPEIGRCLFKVWETGVNITRKMNTAIQLKFSQWFDFEAEPVHPDYRVSKIPEYIVKYNDIKPLDPKVTEGWKSYMKIFSYDIETYSSNHNAFPTEHYAKDVAWIITIVAQLAGHPETRKRYAIVLGETKPSTRAEIIKVETEMELLNEFKRLLIELDPDVITGYNILGFDNKYLNARLKRRLQEWGKLGRSHEESDVDKISWSSSGYGHREMHYFKMAGRINIDLFQVISREHKFSTYTLDAVSNKFLGRGKHPVDAKEMFRIFALSQQAKGIYNEELATKYISDCIDDIDDPEGWMAANMLVSLPRENDMALSLKLKNRSHVKGERGPVHPKEFLTEEVESQYKSFHKILKQFWEYVSVNDEMNPMYAEVWNRYCIAIVNDVDNITTEQLYSTGWQAANILAQACLEQNLITKVRTNPHMINIEQFTDSRAVLKYIKAGKIHHSGDDSPLVGTNINLKPNFERLWHRWRQIIVNGGPNDLREIYTMWLGTSLHYDAINEVHKVVEYGIEDAELPMDLYDKLDIGTVLVETSNVCGVPMSQLYTRGQQVRGVSLVYDLCVKKGYVMDQRFMEKVEMAGGFVFPPKAGLYDYVICLDFASLYPTIIMAYNICWTTLVPPELMDIIPDYMCHIIEWTEEGEVKEVDPDDPVDDDDDEMTASSTERHFRFKFIKKEYKKGILPTLVGELVDERYRVRLQIKETSDPVVKGILNSRQLALKVCANSMYGLLGAQLTGKLSLVEGAASVTALGRQSIILANDHLEENYGAKVVYNDTDSTMVDMGYKSGLECVTEGPKLAKELSKLYPAPMKFEFEKAMRIICFKKKKYAAFLYADYDMYDENGQLIWKKGDLITDKNDIFVRGIILARRDNCAWQRQIYREILWRILMYRPLQDSMDILMDHINKLLRRQVPLRDLVIVRGLGSNYKSASYFMKVFSDELRKIGKPAQAGERLEYVVVRPHGWDGKEKLLLGKKMRLVDVYLERQRSSEPEPIDVQYYIEKTLMNPIEQIISVGYMQEIAAKMEPYKDDVKRRNKLYTRMDNKPIKTILNILKERQKHIDQIKTLCPIWEMAERYPAQLEIIPEAA